MKRFNNGNGWSIARVSGTGSKYGNEAKYMLYVADSGACTTPIVEAAEVFGELIVKTMSGSVYVAGPALSLGDKIKLYTCFNPTVVGD